MPANFKRSFYHRESSRQSDQPPQTVHVRPKPNQKWATEWARKSFSGFCSMKTTDLGGAGGIRTLDTLLTYTHFPGERLRPLGHRSALLWKRRT